MPWTALSEPSLGLGILKAQLAREGIPSRVLHLNIFLLKYLKASTYFGIGEAFALNDFMFTHVLEPTIAPEQHGLLDQRVAELLSNGAGVWLEHDDHDTLRNLLIEVRNVAIPAFLNDCVERVGRAAGTMVGFTCLFDQTIASVAMAKLIKQKYSSTLIALGGYALQGDVGRQVIESFPWIDAVASGDGEEIIAPLARASLDRTLLSRVRGIIYRPSPEDSPVASALPAAPIDLDQSPAPDYDDYVLDVQELERDEAVTIRWDTIPIESSRGCWWGQRKHCVFCGIDDETMKYRHKAPETVLDMLSGLERRYGFRQFRFSDYILPFSYYQTLLPRLAAVDPPYTLSCEMKANIDLPRFRMMRDAGFVEVQPGIESFSTSVLRKMDKGVKAIQNIYTLILGYRLDIEVHYNFLFGFPTDDVTDYDELLRTIPLLYHLTPPISRNAVVTTRFAPMQANPTRFGIEGPIRHDERYEILFSRAYQQEHRFDYDKYCYYYETPYTTGDDLLVRYALLRHQIQYWKDIHRKRAVRLSFQQHGAGLRILDSRYSEDPTELLLTGPKAQVYCACADSITPLSEIRSRVSSTVTDDELSDALESLAEARVLFREGNLCLGLAIPAAVYEAAAPLAKSAKWVSPYV
jgi:ribosomal peptide maturation radical SAM protein 1